MQAIILTAAEKDALLKELELEKFKCQGGNLYVMNGDKLPNDQLQHMMAETIHRRMHYLVCKALS